jgi:small multidrug resistance pump
MALKRLDMGIAYAVWAGVGTALMAIIGILFFGESISLIKIISIIFIMLGVIGLNLSQA